MASFLTAVKEHVFQSIKRTFGSSLFEALPLDMIVTVPAVWSDGAKELTFKAVMKAGLFGSNN